MKTESQLNHKIIHKILEIQALYPELTPFLDEMRTDSVGASSNTAPQSISSLKAYYDSLDTLLTSYRVNALCMRTSL